MKKFTKFLTVSALSMAVLTPVFALQEGNTESNGYLIKAYKDCELVHEQVMNSGQIDAYLDLKEQEKKMHDVELTLEGVEEELEQYTSALNELTELAIQETDDTLFIDKQKLREQEEVAQQLEAFMEQHEDKYEAIAKQGKAIGDIAEKFTDALESDLSDIDYDDLHIITPDSENHSRRCYSYGM